MAKPIQPITPKDLKARLDSGEKIYLIDVREPFERDIATIGGELIPLKTVIERAAEIPREGTVVVYCRSGGRSGQAVEALQDKCGFTNLLNLKGGVLAWSDEVDSSIKKY